MDITFVTESILITSSVSKVVQSTLCTLYTTISKQTLMIFLIYWRIRFFDRLIYMRDYHFIKPFDISLELYILIENFSYFQTGD